MIGAQQQPDLQIMGQPPALGVRPSTPLAAPSTLAIKQAPRPATASSEEADPNDVNVIHDRLLGSYLRERMLMSVPGAAGAREVVKAAFRHLHRGQGHVLSWQEFKGGLAGSFGSQMPLSLIKATFDLFDTDPRTWLVDFDEFCQWLDTGRRRLTPEGLPVMLPGLAGDHGGAAGGCGGKRHGGPHGAVEAKMDGAAGGGVPGRAGRRMSDQQLDRMQAKAGLMKHKNRLAPKKLTEPQRTVLDQMLLEKIAVAPSPQTADAAASAVSKAGSSGEIGGTWHAAPPPAGGRHFDVLKTFQALSQRCRGRIDAATFSREARRHLPRLADKDGGEASLMFGRLDSDRDGLVDLADFMVWAQRTRDGAIAGDQTDDWEAQDAEQARHTRACAAVVHRNPLVPDDYDGSTWLGRLNRNSSGGGGGGADGKHKKPCMEPEERARIDRLLREKVLGKIRGGPFEMLRAFRHFRPAGVGRRLYLDYKEFHESIKGYGLGITDDEVKQLFAHFDTDGSGEIDFAEFRKWLSSNTATGLQLEDPARNATLLKMAEAQRRASDAALQKASATAIERVHGRNTDEVLRERILAKIKGGEMEALRAFRHFRAPEAGRTLLLNMPGFEASIKGMGLVGLSGEEMKALFGRFDRDGSGAVDFIEFRNWLLAGNISTGLHMEEVPKRASIDGATKDIVELHRALKAKVAAAVASGPRELLRAFRRSAVRQHGGGGGGAPHPVRLRDFQDALRALDVAAPIEYVTELFSLYNDRGQESMPFQRLVERIMTSDSPPPLVTPQQRAALLAAPPAPPLAWPPSPVDADDDSAEDGLRIPEARDRTATKKDAKSGSGNSSGGGGGNGGVGKSGGHGSGKIGSDSVIDAERASLLLKLSRGSAAEEHVKPFVQAKWRYLLRAFRDADPAGIGMVERSAFIRALTGLPGAMGTAEIEQIAVRHQLPVRTKCPQMVDYRGFLRHFLVDLRVGGWQPRPRTSAGVSTSRHSRGIGGGGTLLSSTQPLPAVGGATGPRPCTAGGVPGGGHDGRGIRSSGGGTVVASKATVAEAWVASGRSPGAALAGAMHQSCKNGGGSGGGCTLTKNRHGASMPALSMVGGADGSTEGAMLLPRRRAAVAAAASSVVSAELPQTTDLHRGIKGDLMKVLGPLASDLKKRESPYRRGVVSAAIFAEACNRHGINMKQHEVEQLIRFHRHSTGGYGGGSSGGGGSVLGSSASNGSLSLGPSLRYGDFLRTCASAAAPRA